LTGSEDKTAKLWDVASGVAFTLRHEGEVYAARYSPDGRTVVTGNRKPEGGPGQTWLWETASGKAIASLPHNDYVVAVAYSPDGRFLLTASNNNPAQVWDTATGKLTLTLRHDAGVSAVAYSPDGGTILTGGDDSTARLWEAATGKPLAILRHENVSTAVWGPGGRTVLTGGYDRTARLWDAATGKLLATLLHDYSVRAVACSSDGRTILTWSNIGQSHSDRNTIRLWELLPSAPDQPKQLQAWVHMQAGSWFDERGVLVPLSREQRLQTWEQLHQEGGDWRIPTSAPDWHSRQADAAEEGKDWFAALFHLKRLRALQPGNGDLLRRMEAAHLHLGQKGTDQR
jgi:WD40 repeat protein